MTGHRVSVDREFSASEMQVWAGGHANRRPTP